MIIYVLGVRLSKSARRYINARPTLNKFCTFLENKADHDREYYHVLRKEVEQDIETLAEQSELYRYKIGGYTGIKDEDDDYQSYLDLRVKYERDYFPHGDKLDFSKLSGNSKLDYGALRSKVDTCLGLEPSIWEDEPVYSLDTLLSLI